MNIEVRRNQGLYLIFTADNVHVDEDIEERIYPKLENGKTDFSKPPLRCVITSSLTQIVDVLDTLIDFRKREYDSSDLIKGLVEKLPEKERVDLLKKLVEDYDL